MAVKWAAVVNLLMAIPFLCHQWVWVRVTGIVCWSRDRGLFFFFGAPGLAWFVVKRPVFYLWGAKWHGLCQRSIAMIAGHTLNDFFNNVKVTDKFSKVGMKSLEFWWSCCSRDLGRLVCVEAIKLDPDWFKGAFFPHWLLQGCSHVLFILFPFQWQEDRQQPIGELLSASNRKLQTMVRQNNVQFSWPVEKEDR